MHGSGPNIALLRALCVLCICSSVLAGSEQELVDWMESRGGQVHFKTERACATCVRGAFASRSFEEGDIVARVPANSSIALGPGVASEQAYVLLQRMQREPAFNHTFHAYMAAMPGPEELLSAEMFSDEDLGLLQTPELERLTRQRREMVERVYKRKGAPEFSLESLKHMTALIRTRNFWLLGEQRLVPSFDMLNHSEDPSTNYTDDGDDFMVLRATRSIAEGEEVTDSYKQGLLHRGDASLFHYGFLQGQERPLLCTVDLPSYSPADPWQATPGSDDHLASFAAGTFLGDLQLRREYQRLAGLLAQMPTTESQDKGLLASGRLVGWRQQLLVQFRLQRKRALRLALERLEQAWLAGHPSEADAACGARGGEVGMGTQLHDEGEGQGLYRADFFECLDSKGWSMHSMLSQSVDALVFLARLPLKGDFIVPCVVSAGLTAMLVSKLL